MTVIPILLYHSISAEPEGWIAPYAVTPTAFARHVDQIATSGRTAMTVSELCDALAGRTPLPELPIVITFDDGFADFAYAAKVLAARGLPSTLYVTTGALGGRCPRPPDMAIPPAAMLDWSQLAELTELGVEVGSHTHTHPQLDTMRNDAVADEIRCSKGLLEDALGCEVPSFAYPHGFQSGRTRRVVASAGHRSACAVMNALSSDGDDIYALARLTVTAATRPAGLAAWLSGRGARIAPFPERLRTTAWRLYRRARGPGSRRGVIAESVNRDVNGAISAPETHQ
jgi:peptidoglycan/xylan/chitin deacetylase (PgdA/CDA1 family)